MRVKKLISLSITAALVFQAQALTLEECQMLALEHYPEIKQYDLIGQTEQYTLANIARSWLPQVMLSAQATYQSATATYPELLANMLAANGMEMAGLKKAQYKVAIDITQNIWDGGMSKANRATANADAAQQRRSADVDLYNLKTRINDLYFGYLLLGERITLSNTKIELLNSSFAKVQSYHRNGVAMQSDVDAVEVELLSTRQTIELLKASQASFRRMLEAFTGRTLAGETLHRPEIYTLYTHTSARPELELFEARLKGLNAREKTLTASLMPRFSAFAQGYYGYPGLDMFESMRSSKLTLNGIVGIRMSWNLGALYTRKSSLQSIDVARRQVEVQRDVFLFNTQLQSIQEEDEIVRLRGTLDTDSRIVELRRSMRLAAESQLANGVIDTDDLLKKIAAETAAETDRSTHELELLQAIYKLKHTLNQ